MCPLLTVSVIINTKHATPNLSQCLQSIDAQTLSPVEVIVMAHGMQDAEIQGLKTSWPSLIILPLDAGTGFAAGKNKGVNAATGDICLFINDASELVSQNAIRNCVEYFEKTEELGCLSLRIVDSEDRIIMKFIPRRDRKIIAEDMPGANFIAAACALRRAAFLEAGGLWEALDPHFGGEPELSYRLLDKGYSILHTPYIVARCHEVRQQRKVGRRLYSGTRNTPWIALRNLPWYSVIGLTVLSWGYFLLIALRDGQLSLFLKGVAHSMRYWPTIYRSRKPIGKKAIATLWRHSGIILY